MSGGRMQKPVSKLREIIIAKIQAGKQCVGLKEEEEDYSELAEAGLEFWKQVWQFNKSLVNFKKL